MSIEVVVKGNKRPEDRVYRNTCNHCGSLLQFNASDGYSAGTGPDGSAIVVTCPECKTEVWTAIDAYQKPMSDADIKALTRRMGG
ncbi:hypothetical protein [Rhizobium leguminosarum]|uniref:hypothetical protein n=1 Tax=Rhizobium leguminosarum TaxID=384 RepID=UPI000B929105|nr:hypothetical protein [Rhizobium leguminosarum]ASS55884.1 hypothetical protein CHR56_15655 [Rhizobium leguminosarum bv. viciae]